MNDSRQKSHFEQIVNQVTGYLVGVAINYIIFPIIWLDTNHTVNWSVSLIYVAASYVRGYIFRRIFERLPADYTFNQMFQQIISYIRKV